MPGEILLGQRVVVTYTNMALQGKPRQKQTIVVGNDDNPMYPIQWLIPAGPNMEEEVKQRVFSIREVLQHMQSNFLKPPGLPPGASNMSFGTNVENVYAVSDENGKLTIITRPA